MSKFRNIRFWESWEQVVGHRDHQNRDKEKPEREEDGSGLTGFGFHGFERQVLDRQVREGVKSDSSKYKGGISEVDCGCRFPKGEIEESFQISSSQCKEKDHVLTWTFRPVGCGGSVHHHYTSYLLFIIYSLFTIQYTYRIPQHPNP
jgi:hypothetical protein